jgi:glucosylceramidase
LGALVLIASSLVGLWGCHSGSRKTLVEVVQTSRDLSQRLTRLPDLWFGTSLPRGIPVIHVDDKTRYQRIVGVGAAITDTSAWLLHDELSPSARAAVIRKLFGAGGIHLGFVRVPIGASDFTKDGRPYSYDDVPWGQSDPHMRRFSVAHDDTYIIPTLRQTLVINPRVKIIASPWSPPRWMKTNHALDNTGNRGKLLATAYGPWAHYFVRFIQAYASRGVKIDAISVQNEPGQQARYPGLNLPEPSEAAFVSRYLAPSLSAAGLHPMIYGHDFKWLLWARARALISDPAVAKTFAGIAWHCYDGNPTAMTALHRANSGLDQIESECSSGSSPGPPAELMIASFRNWATGVLLWNMALDPHGGPVQRPNHGCPHCTGVVTVDERTHTVSYRADYYQLGQFSAFVQPGARRIGSESFVEYNSHDHYHRVSYATAGLDDVAFTNPRGSTVLLAHNNAGLPKRFVIDWHGHTFTYTLPAGATVTFVWG